MLFQTFEFAIFYMLVLVGVVAVRQRLPQFGLLLLASYVFYMAWEPAGTVDDATPGWSPYFILLIVYSTLNDYLCGLGLGRSRQPRARTLLLVLSLVTNLGVLAIFKYTNFLYGTTLWMSSGQWPPPEDLFTSIVLPVGISFYTFQSMSYTIDVYRGELPAERNFTKFALYVAFFPQLVAGPILRAKEFMPQLDKAVDLKAENLRSGINLFLVGLVKKVVIADNVAPLANQVFDQPQGLPSAAIMLGALAFGIQIYCDFSGYTDMARGCGRMLGFHIPINFNYPYAARSITDFWRRWHISLSSWLRDYLYIPLGGNRHGSFATYRNLMLTMTLGGLWHGAGWNFVIWGVYQGFWLAVERLLGVRHKSPDSSAQPTVLQRAARWLLTALQWLFVQYLVFFGWLIFRVYDSSDLLYCMRKYVLFDFNLSLSGLGLGAVNPFVTLGVMFAFIALHTVSYRMGGFANRLDQLTGAPRFIIYVLAVFVLALLWPAAKVDFIYFDF